ncbi:MAG: amidohydrolase family protein [Candidatus Velthaea sp.]
MLHTVFEDARIHDGTGNAAYTTDIAIVDGRIALIGDCSERDAIERISCDGLSIAPGFIDVHSHSDELWLADSRALGKIFQGVTTEIGGNCGTSVGPLRDFALERKRRDVRQYRVDVQWQNLDEFFGLIEHHGVALNVATLVGLGTTRACVAGPADRRLDAEEHAAQLRLVREAVDHGALGVSSGLIYEPSRYADLAELTACAAAARDAGAPRYVSHIRDEADGVIAAIHEALAVGEGADVAVQCSHHKAAGRRNWGKVHQTLDAIEQARARGHDVGVDVYPYVASWTELATILPEGIRSGGDTAALERLRDPKIAAGVAFALNLARDPVLGGDSWSDILITDVGSERNANVAGYRIDELARVWRLSPARTVIRLLLEEEMNVQCAFFSMSEDDVATVMSASFASIGSDASARAFEGITARGVPHPRTYGCFPRVFGRFVRQRRTLAIEEAVRRMTSLAADQFGLRDRGRIAAGMWADVVVFDEATIADRATYERPFVKPAGIRDVLVNGRAVIRNGTYTGALPGRVLRGGR